MKKLFILVFILWASQVFAFTSIYSFGKTYSYCSKTKSPMCTKNVFPCLGEYQCQKRYVGFKDMYNPHIFSSTDFTVNVTTLSSIVKPADTARIPRMFKIYIPVGTKQISATIYTPRDVKQGVAVRLNKPPIYCNLPFNEVAWKPYTQVSLASLEDHDAYLSALGGSTQLFAPTANCSESGWLYIESFPVSQIYAVQVRFTVDREVYTNWYDNATWDAYGDPIDIKTQKLNVLLPGVIFGKEQPTPKIFYVNPGLVSISADLIDINNGQLINYIWVDQAQVGFNIKSDNPVKFEKTVKVTDYNYTVYYGRILKNGTIMYNVFKLRVK